MRSVERLLVPSKSEAFEVDGSIWVDTGNIIYRDSTGTERILSTLTFEVVGEVLTEINDTFRINFTTDKDFEDIKIYRNGMRQGGNGNDYVITGTNQIQLTTPLIGAEVLIADYTTKDAS